MQNCSLSSLVAGIKFTHVLIVLPGLGVYAVLMDPSVLASFCLVTMTKHNQTLTRQHHSACGEWYMRMNRPELSYFNQDNILIPPPYSITLPQGQTYKMPFPLYFCIYNAWFSFVYLVLSEINPLIQYFQYFIFTTIIFIPINIFMS